MDTIAMMKTAQAVDKLAAASLAAVTANTAEFYHPTPENTEKAPAANLAHRKAIAAHRKAFAAEQGGV